MKSRMDRRFLDKVGQTVQHTTSPEYLQKISKRNFQQMSGFDPSQC